MIRVYTSSCGATIENILNFDRSFNNVKVIKLEQNYRSTSNIIAAANAIIKTIKIEKAKNYGLVIPKATKYIERMWRQ